MSMKFNHLAIFHAVAQTGSMTLGAERLDISQPAVSKQVHELESSLRVDALAHEAEEAMADVRSVGRGTLRIGASTTIGTYLLPPVVAEFWRRHPKVELLVQIENTEQVQRRLILHELDVGLTEGF